MIDVKAAAGLLKTWDDVLILTHTKPDGDTLGGGFGLLFALEALGRRARLENAEGIPERYRFLCGEYLPDLFEPRFIVSVDVAGPDLLGELKKYDGEIDLCVDHHTMNTLKAKKKLVDSGQPAASLIVYDIIKALGVTVDKKIATALFTGISTDTGCFKYYSVTPGTHRAAAELIEAGADHGLVNMLMFDSMSPGRAALEAIIKSTLEFRLGGLCAVITVSRDAVSSCGVDEADLDGISSFPRRIEGVAVGLTLREKENGYRVSVRARENLDAAAMCARFGGGGHRAAAGCTIEGTKDEVMALLLPAVSKMLEEAGYKWS
ncbi:MAG: DHH family phosphoesterase [Oscillospiraceae bacterium]|jgi:phosphoesterase RecJ-like protein|nr:DHH family phosphoesterase [Oscillospiraceae bacterium]